MKLVECVPNFSEGRRAEVINAIRDAIASVDGVSVLEVSSDPSHNRSVITFVAPVETAVDAAFAGIQAAKERIDLSTHTGEHPRIGQESRRRAEDSTPALRARLYDSRARKPRRRSKWRIRGVAR